MRENGSSDEPFTKAELNELDALVRAAFEAHSTPVGGGPTLEFDAREGSDFGRFKHLALVGRGGFGSVYRAFDPKLRRYVALKIPHLRNTVDPAVLRRFRVEAEAVAKIDHPGVTTLYEVGEADGLPYLSSAYCEGRNLSQWRRGLAEDGRKFEPETAVRIALATAKALAAAHAAGVIHRDLKPSNIVLQPSLEAPDVTIDGAPYRVRVVDFGLAKLLGDNGEQTRTNFHLGTPPYMAPEQFSRRFGLTSPLTDVYGLGATLFALLAGRAPFKADEPIELYSQILADAPPSLRKLRPGVPKALEAVCRRCLEKEPSDRFTSIQEVAADLERFLDGRRVRANWSWLRKSLLGSRRRRTLTMTGGFIAIAATLWFINGQIESYRRERDVEAAKAGRLADEKEEIEYLAAVQQAFTDYEASNVKGIRNFLARYAGTTHLHHSEWKLLRGLSDTAVWTVQTDSPEVHSTAISPDPANPVVYSGLRDGRIEVRSKVAGALRLTLHRHAGPVNWMEFLDGGRTLVSSGEDGYVRVWDARSGKMVREFKAHDDWIAVGRASTDGKLFVTCAGDKRIRLWSLPSFTPCGLLEGHADAVRDASFSHDGKYLVSCGEDRQMYLWDVERRARICSFPQLEADVVERNRWARHVHFVGRGSPYRVAASFFKGHVVLYRVEPGKRPQVEWTRDVDVKRSSVPSGGDVFYFTRGDGGIAKVDLSKLNSPVARLGVGHEDAGFAIAVDESIGETATGDRDGMLRYWSSKRDSLGWTYSNFRGVAGFAGDDFVVVDRHSPGQGLVVLGAREGQVVHVQENLKEKNGAASPLVDRALRFRAEIWRRMSAGWQCLSLSGGRPELVERSIPHSRDQLSDGPFPVVSDQRRGGISVRSLDLKSEVAWVSILLKELQVAYLSFDAKWAACEFPGALRLFRLDSPSSEVKLEAADQLGFKGGVSFSPDGGFVCIALKDSKVVVWSTTTGRRHATVSARGEDLKNAAVTAGGKRVFAVDRKGRLYLWDAASGILLGSFSTGGGDVIDADLEMDSRGSRLLVFIRRSGEHHDSVRMINLVD